MSNPYNAAGSFWGKMVAPEVSCHSLWPKWNMLISQASSNAKLSGDWPHKSVVCYVRMKSENDTEQSLLGDFCLFVLLPLYILHFPWPAQVYKIPLSKPAWHHK